MKYDPPKSDILLTDPVHQWRATTGIELIHKEPTIQELERIWNNWGLMTKEQKEISDKKSIEFFNLTNKEHYIKIKGEICHNKNNKNVNVH